MSCTVEYYQVFTWTVCSRHILNTLYDSERTPVMGNWLHLPRSINGIKTIGFWIWTQDCVVFTQSRVIICGATSEFAAQDQGPAWTNPNKPTQYENSAQGSGPENSNFEPLPLTSGENEKHFLSYKNGKLIWRAFHEMKQTNMRSKSRKAPCRNPTCLASKQSLINQYSVKQHTNDTFMLFEHWMLLMDLFQCPSLQNPFALPHAHTHAHTTTKHMSLHYYNHTYALSFVS